MNNSLRVGLSVLGIVGCFVGSYFFSHVHGSRQLSGVTVESRADRGADESIRRGSGPAARGEPARLDGATDDDYGSGSTADLSPQALNRARSDFLQERYPQYSAFTSVETHDGSHSLRWPMQYAPKRAIIIHHTADNNLYEFPYESRKAIRDIYNSHANGRRRGDIGYNFLIDPFGTVFEGRAGGTGVVGAHAAWNNATTIGVSLMGNYHLKEPSPAMRDSLVDLVTMLSFENRIWPDNFHTYFQATAEPPYLSVFQDLSIIGHRDAGDTVCPGDYVYRRLPELRKSVTERLQRLARNGVTTLSDSNFTRRLDPFLGSGSETVVWFDARNSDNQVACQSFTPSHQITTCTRLGDKIMMTIPYPGSGAETTSTFGITQGNESRFASFSTVREQDLPQHHKTFSRSKPQNNNNIVTIQQAQQATQSPISVLLYDLTAQHENRVFGCEGACSVLAGTRQFKNPTSILVSKSGNDRLQVIIDEEVFWAENFGIASQGGLISVKNYSRVSGTDSLNSFRGSITITSSKRMHRTQGEQQGFVVVNTLPFSDYMRGVAERAPYYQDSTLALLAVLTKQYALFHRAGTLRHGSVPAGVGYHIVDHPELFQGYVGAGQEAYASRRLNAVAATENRFVITNKSNPTLPLLPYSFNGSVTNTTPQRISLRHADLLVDHGASVSQILDWYFPGVHLVGR